MVFRQYWPRDKIMDISAYKNINSYGASLTDYLNTGKGGHFDALAQNLLANITQKQNAVIDTAAEKNVQVTLSAEAQALLTQAGSDNTAQNGVQKTAQNFVIGFFDQSGIDEAKLSGEAFDLISGLLGVISGSGATTRDMATDTMEMRYAENGKKVYTLTGNNTRLRLAIDYNDDGSPKKLSITDISGGQVETAEITLGKDEDGVMRMNIDRTQREYRNGHMVTTGEIEPLAVKLYTA